MEGEGKRRGRRGMGGKKYVIYRGRSRGFEGCFA